jgi:hypothetical protein
MEVSIRNDIASVRSRPETAMNSIPQQLRACVAKSSQRSRPDPDNDAPGAVLAGEQLPNSKDASTQTDFEEAPFSYQDDSSIEETAERTTHILTGLVDQSAREMASHMMSNPVQVNQAVIMPAVREVITEYVLDADMPLDEVDPHLLESGLTPTENEEIDLLSLGYANLNIAGTHDDRITDKGLDSKDFLNKMDAPATSSTVAPPLLSRCVPSPF